MRTQLIPFFFALFTISAVMAQPTRMGAHEAVTTWTPSTDKSLKQSDVQQVIQKILDAVGAKANFIIQPASIQNAAAVTYGGKRYILYSPTFMRELAGKAGTEWGPISVLAHEVGHHIYPAKAGMSQQQLELQADEFSGFALRKMGSTVEEAQAAMRTLASDRATRTHPGQADRLWAIENGWRHADAAIQGIAYQPKVRTTEATSKAGSRVASGHASAMRLNRSAILGQVVFDTAPNHRIYITRGLNLVQERANSIATIGKVIFTNNGDYPYIISDNTTRLLVDKKGNIITRAGKRVGILLAYRS